MGLAGCGPRRRRVAARVEDHATVPDQKSFDLQVEAAAGAAVLVHEQDRGTRAAHLAVEAHSIDGSDRAHSALNPRDTSMIRRARRYRRGSIESRATYSASFECAPKPCNPKRSRTGTLVASASLSLSMREDSQ